MNGDFPFFSMGQKKNKKRAAKQRIIASANSESNSVISQSSQVDNTSQSDFSELEFEVTQGFIPIPEKLEPSKEEPSAPLKSLLSQNVVRLNKKQSFARNTPAAELEPGKATTATEQFLSQSISKSELHGLPQQSIPNSIPRRLSTGRAHTPNSYFKNSYKKSILDRSSNNGESDSEHSEYSQTHREIIQEHLVQPSPIQEERFGSLSHNLVGGAITRDIYKWQEDNEKRPLLRSKSQPTISITNEIEQSISQAIREPGGFRRHFIANQAERQGKKPPNFLTKNFIDFLLLYGFYGGDVYPSDDDLSDDEEIDVEDGEGAPLLRTQSMQSLKGTSESKAFFMLLKAFVGTGVLFLPKAFMNGGLIFSLITMTILGYLTMHCMLLLVESSRSYGGKSFGELGELMYGERFRTLILFSISVSQIGFCCAYFIFVGQNMRDLLMLSSGCKWIYPDWVFIIAQVLVYVPLALVRKIKKFGVSSLVADVFILVGLGYIFVFGVSVIAENGAQPVTFINLQSFPLFIGTAMFAFEGICLVLPIAESMKHPEQFNRVVEIGVLVVAAIFMSIGTLGYFALGSKVETNIFLNLPTNPAVSAIQFFYAIAIMLSFPLCVYPAIRIIEQSIRN
jgi:proton-coupled amino acid transporter